LEWDQPAGLTFRPTPILVLTPALLSTIHSGHGGVAGEDGAGVLAGAGWRDIGTLGGKSNHEYSRINWKALKKAGRF